MKKQSKQLVILFVALVLLIAGLMGLKQYNKMQEQKPSEDSAITVIDVERDDIIRFSYDYEGVTYTFEKEGEVWYYVEDHSIPIDENSIKVMIGKLAPLEAEEEICNVTDMTQYGLDKPAKRIQFETAEESYVINLGSLNSVASVYYMCQPSETTVYTVKTPVMSVFNKTLEDVTGESEETEAATESAEAVQ